MQQALDAVATQRSSKVPEIEAQELIQNASEYWNDFYDRNRANFFKDRNWLGIEFPELFAPLSMPLASAVDVADIEPFVVMEVGCGAGNTVRARQTSRPPSCCLCILALVKVFPLLAEHRKRQATDTHRKLFMHASDFSSSAVDVVLSSVHYDPSDMNAFVYDLTSPDLPSSGPAPETVDVLVLVFVLSALHPDRWAQAMLNIWKVPLLPHPSPRLV